jgi:uncharacterized protein YodC (DUF2158 family)
MKEGDVVRLKSGGPLMIIISKVNDYLVECAWFDGDIPKTSTFPIIAIDLPVFI